MSTIPRAGGPAWIQQERAAQWARRLLLIIAAAGVGTAGYAWVHHETLLVGLIQFIFFLGLPAAVAAGALFSCTRTLETQALVLVASASLATGLLFAELTLFGLEEYGRLSASRSEATSAAPAVERADPRTTRQFILDRWREGESIYPRIYQLSTRTVEVAGTSFFATSHLSDERILECYADGQFKVYRSDSNGFTNPPVVARTPVQVALIGDSFTAGVCVSLRDDIAARMRQRIPGTLNLGISGAGPLWELANLVEHAIPARAEHVFWLYYEGNDLADLEYERHFPELTHYLQGSSRSVRALKAQIDAQVRALQRQEIESLAIRELRGERARNWKRELAQVLKLPRLRVRLGLHGSYERDIAQRVDLLERVVVRARSLVEDSGARFTFVYLPDFSRFAGASVEFERERVLGVLERNEVETVDLLVALRLHRDPIGFYPGRRPGHFNAAGYAWVADQLIEAAHRPASQGSNTGAARALGGGSPEEVHATEPNS